MTGQRLCPVCGRVEVEEGAVNRVDAARAVDGGYLHCVEELVRHGRRNSQLDRLANLAVVIDDFVAQPQRLRANEVNDLGDDLWELKAGTLRVPFFGAPCPGDHSSAGEQRRLVLPDVVAQPRGECRTARLTHIFEKRTRRTPRRELDKAQAIRREDLR